LNAFLTQCDYCGGKWKILGIVDEGVNNETGILLQYWDFHGQNVDEAWYLLEWITWDSFEFEKASCVSRFFFPTHVHSILDHIMLLFDVTYVILLTIILHHVLIIHVVINLTLHHQGIVLILS